MKFHILVALPAVALALGDNGPEASIRIVGGADVNGADNKWAYLASLRGANGGAGCGGSLVDPEWVLTAAHCVEGNGGLRLPAQVVINDKVVNRVGAEEIKRTVVKGVLHPKRNARNSAFDFALLKLNQPVTGVKPVKISTSIPAAGTNVIAAGFGAIRENGPQSNTLREVTVQVITNQQCSQQYGNFDANSMVCAMVGGGGKDTCQGDSGGPLMTLGGELVGVVSFGSGCARANAAGVYARASEAIDFIRSTKAADGGGNGGAAPTPKPTAAGAAPTRKPTAAAGNGAGNGGAANGNLLGKQTDYIRVMIVNDGASIGVDAATRQAFRVQMQAAADRWNKVITSKLTPVRIGNNGVSVSRCGTAARIPAGTTVNNVIIFATLEKRDGPGGVLASAGTCLQTQENGKVFARAGRMSFDVDDTLKGLENGRFQGTVEHEMGHVLGIGGNQGFQVNVQGKETDDPTYTGKNGVAGFKAVGGKGNAVPVENVGGGGTRNVHIRSSFFKTELMQGFKGQASAMSAITMGILKDLGYTVNDRLADAYTIPAASQAKGAGEGDWNTIQDAEVEADSGWEVVDFPEAGDRINVLTEDGEKEEVVQQSSDGTDSTLLAVVGAGVAAVGFVAFAVYKSRKGAAAPASNVLPVQRDAKHAMMAHNPERYL